MTQFKSKTGAKALATVAGTALLTGCAMAQDSGKSNMSDPDLVTKQEPGNIVYWIPPGPRELSPTVFGTADDPRMTGEEAIAEADRRKEAGMGPPSVPQLLRDFPFLVGVPEDMRQTRDDGTQVVAPTAFSDDGRIVEGSFESRFYDNINEDPPGPPGKTPDKAEMEAEFTDPQGNEYRVVLDHVVKPPFPGYETDGGVLLNDFLHGDTGTGAPLMPQVWTIGAWWGIAEIYVNGEMVTDHQVAHLMTTETVRKNDYSLAQQEELPLKPGDWHVQGQPHHTHLFVMPFHGTPEGPKFKPAPTAFELPNGENQPFIHVMFEQDQIEY